MPHLVPLASLSFAVLALADTPRLQSLPLAVPSVVDDTEMSVAISGVSPATDVMLVGYLSVPDDAHAKGFYGCVCPAIARVEVSASEIADALTGLGHAESVPPGPGPYHVPVSPIAATLAPLANECIGGGMGFSPAALALAQRFPSQEPLWRAISPGPIFGLIDWAATYSGGEYGSGFMNQERLARRLLVHQFAATGQTGLSPTSEEIDQIIFLASRVNLELHVLPIAVLPGTLGEFERPIVPLGKRSWAITFTPTGQPSGFFRRTDVADGVFEYPGTNVYPFEIQTAVPLQDPELLPLLELVLPNGVAIPAQGTVGSDRLVCDLPSTPSGLFSVRNSATHEVVLLAAPGGTSAVAKLQFLWLD